MRLRGQLGVPIKPWACTAPIALIQRSSARIDRFILEQYCLNTNLATQESHRPEINAVAVLIFFNALKSLQR